LLNSIKKDGERMVRPSTDFARMVFFCTFAGKTKIHDSKGSYNKGFRKTWR
jgi:hypothetical protein